MLCKYESQLNNPCFEEFEGNRLTEESLPSFPGITRIFQEFEGNRLTGDSLPLFPGIPGNFREFEFIFWNFRIFPGI